MNLGFSDLSRDRVQTAGACWLSPNRPEGAAFFQNVPNSI